jgi:beta-alanine degradation protein BauB
MRILLLLLLLPAASIVGCAQDPVRVDPVNHRGLFENEHIRVLEYRDKPGNKAPMHSHPAYMTYVTGTGKTRIVQANGESNVEDTAGSEFACLPASQHATENVGNTPSQELLVEFKDVTNPCSSTQSGASSSSRTDSTKVRRTVEISGSHAPSSTEMDASKFSGGQETLGDANAGAGQVRTPGISGAATQGSELVTFVSAQQLLSQIRKAPPEIAGFSWLDYLDTSTGHAEVVRRTTPGRAELHKLAVDIWYVVEGSGTLVTGGTLAGKIENAPRDVKWDTTGGAGELRGTGISGGEERHMATGDFVAIPAGTPHWLSKIDGEFIYLLIKVPPSTSGKTADTN